MGRALGLPAVVPNVFAARGGRFPRDHGAPERNANNFSWAGRHLIIFNTSQRTEESAPCGWT
jgi:hypothetical protein